MVDLHFGTSSEIVSSCISLSGSHRLYRSTFIKFSRPFPNPDALLFAFNFSWHTTNLSRPYKIFHKFKICKSRKPPKLCILSIRYITYIRYLLPLGSYLLLCLLSTEYLFIFSAYLVLDASSTSLANFVYTSAPLVFWIIYNDWLPITRRLT